ncbi:MAG TPA: DcrB-related protein, partial [Thermomicrobiales bacterium]|nr:DcrB-related protein [Thermomicrobiales bacterium]
ANAARATQAAVAAATATAAAAPTATPPPPTVTPTPKASDWGPTLKPLDGGKAYQDPDGRFSLRVPDGWSQAKQSGGEVAFTGPHAGRAAAPTMNVVLQQTQDSLDQFDKSTQQELQKQFEDFKLVSHDKVTVNGFPAYRRVFTVTINDVPMEIEQVYLVDQHTAHTLTFAATPDTFDDTQPTFDGIAGSYQVGK